MMLLLVVSTGTAVAQTIDAGRGELPVHVPAGYDSGTPAPLILLLHGYTASGAQQDAYFNLSGLVDDYGFILVAPDGTEEASERRSRFWNASSSCCNFFGSDVDDVAYLTRLIDAVKAEYAIDDSRIALFGHSNGGFMSYRMAHDRSGIISAMASLAGADQSGSPENPVHVLQIHGTADTVIAYEGGTFRGGDTHPGAKASVEAWAGHNGCSGEGVDTGTLDLDQGLDGLETDVTRYTSGCRAGGAAELWTINEGGHGPAVSDHFSRLVVEWLLAHPKP
jgi:polyhydroxybutyrate depolymerase|tara:strand:+ start:326 stop:1162 length:837 start_codon:yes stop_codon:yes gene_type:complete